MLDTFFDFLKRHSSLIITTHDPADADGLGAELVISQIARTLGKQVSIINSGPIPEIFRFLDKENEVKTWAEAEEKAGKNAALLILDTADEYNIGDLQHIIPDVAEVFILDHHEPNKFCQFKGYIDKESSAVSEMAVELAVAAGVKLSPVSAKAAYAGIVHDTGFFAYPKTTARTFRAALELVNAGAKPYEVYRELCENISRETLLLQKTVLSNLEIHNGNVAIQVLRKSDLEETGASYQDTDNFINLPMKSRDIEVSIFVKENKEGHVRCSLRSKGKVNVSKLAQTMGGGGHVTASGFKSSLDLDATSKVILKRVLEALENK
jgi:phosphoesterase RecJ-like protein